jgi:hypothetical protein
MAEHRLVMEEKLGRMLDKSEVVHHLDGNIRNNHPDNLQMFSANSVHLRRTLTGKRPNWTPEGVLRIAAGCEKAIARGQKQTANLLKSVIDGHRRPR